MAEPNIAKIVIDKIAQELNAIKMADPDFFGRYRIVITNEQQFVKVGDATPNTIFVVVKMLQGNRDFGQHRQPFTINAMAEQNSISVCQRLMMDFAEQYNLPPIESVSPDPASGAPGYTLRQTVSTVAASSNFADAYNGFRSLFYVTGTFFISISGNPITKLEISTDGAWASSDEIDFLSAQLSYSAQPDSQPFYDTNNFTRTVNKIASLSIGFTMYANDSEFYKDILDIVFNKPTEQEGQEVFPDIDKPFYIRIYTQATGNSPYEVTARLVSFSNVQEVRDFPAVSLTFSR